VKETLPRETPTTTPVLLADDPLTAIKYRLGMEFAVYVAGISEKYVVTEIAEVDDRRLTYGIPKPVRTSARST
jgi:hypothetical protein